MPLKVFVSLISLHRFWTLLVLLIKSDISKYGNGGLNLFELNKKASAGLSHHLHNFIIR